MQQRRNPHLSLTVPDAASSSSFRLASPLASPSLAPVALLALSGQATPPTTPPCSALFFNPFVLSTALGRRPSNGTGSAMMSRHSSLSSVCSSTADDDREEVEWTAEEQEMLKQTFDHFDSQPSLAPYTGLPPANLTHVIAKSVASNSAANRMLRSRITRSSENISVDEMPRWRHGLRSTRVKILAMVKERRTHVEATPRQSDGDATPKRRGLVRQGSMDFLPVIKNDVTVARLGSKLQSVPTPTYPASSRLVRTNSLSAIIPTAPSHIAAPPTLHINISSSSSHKMARLGSADGRFKPRSGALSPCFNSPTSFLAPPSSSSSTFDLPLSPRTEMSNWSANVASSMAQLESTHEYITPMRPRTTRLGSAFHSPISGSFANAYPTPVSTNKNGGGGGGLGLGDLLKVPVAVEGFVRDATSEGADYSRSTGGGGGEMVLDDDHEMAYESDYCESTSTAPTSLSASSSSHSLHHQHQSSAPLTIDSDPSLSTSSTTTTVISKKRPLFRSTISFAPDSPSTSSPPASMSPSSVSISIPSSPSPSPSPTTASFNLNDLSLDTLDHHETNLVGDYFSGAYMEQEKVRKGMENFSWNRQ